MQQTGAGAATGAQQQQLDANNVPPLHPAHGGRAGAGAGGSEEPIKSHFVTREGTYKLMTLSEYSRPNRLPLNPQGGSNSVNSAPVRVSFLRIPSASGDAATQPTDALQNAQDERICFNVGRELYVYAYRGVGDAADLSKPIDKRVYKGTFPTCHDFNQTTAAANSCSLIIGFSAGQIQLIDPLHKEQQSATSIQGQGSELAPGAASQQNNSNVAPGANPVSGGGVNGGPGAVSKLFNEDRLIDKTKVTCLRWVPGEASHFLAAHASGCLYLYSVELPCTPTAPTYQFFKAGDGYTINTCKTKCGRNPLYRWQLGPAGAALHEFALTGTDATKMLLATVSQDGYLRVFDYHAMELVGAMRSYFGALLCVAFSPDYKLVATGGEDDLITVYSIGEKRVVCRGAGHRSWVAQVAWDPHTSNSQGGSGVCDLPVDLGCSEEDLRFAANLSNATGNAAAPGFRGPVGSQSQPLPLRSTSADNFSGGSTVSGGGAQLVQQVHMRRQKMNSISSASLTPGISYRLGSVGHDTQLCLWDVTDDVLRQSSAVGSGAQRSHRTSGMFQPQTAHANANVNAAHVDKSSSPHKGAATEGQLAATATTCTDAAQAPPTTNPVVTKKPGMLAKTGQLLTGKRSNQSDAKAKQQQPATSESGAAGSAAWDESSGGSTSRSKPLHKRAISFGGRLARHRVNSVPANPPAHAVDPHHQSGTGVGACEVPWKGVLQGLGLLPGREPGSAPGAKGSIKAAKQLAAGAACQPVADDAARLLGTPACPRLNEAGMLEPLVCKKIAHERLTVLAFRPDCIVTACQEGFICTWARPHQKLCPSGTVPPGVASGVGLSHAVHSNAINSPKRPASPNSAQQLHQHPGHAVVL